jgi:hypothetical protein
VANEELRRVDVCSIFFSQLTINFLSEIIPGDETRCFQYDPESKRLSSQWKQPRSPLHKENLTNEVTFLDITAFVHFEFIPQGQTVSRAYYVEILKRSREDVRRKRPEI